MAPPRIVLLTGPFLTHAAFAQRIARSVPVAAIVRETRSLPQTPWLRRAAARARSTGWSPPALIREARKWTQARARDRALQHGPAVAEPPRYDVHDLNGADGIQLVRSLEPDLMAVCGTSLLSPAVFTSAARAAINLHLGLSPRYRGSHCVFWPLYNREPEWIGITVHRLDARIDAGPILTQRRPALDPADSLDSLIHKSLAIGFDAMADTLSRLIERDIDGIPQQLALGRNYNSREMTPEKVAELEHRLRAGFLREWLTQHGGSAPPVPLLHA